MSIAAASAAMYIHLCLCVHGCVHFEGMPSRWTNLRWDYYRERRVRPSFTRWLKDNQRVRSEVRRVSNFTWQLVGTEGEVLANASEVLSRFVGVIFVGDSQIREVAWAALRFLSAGRALTYRTRRHFLPTCAGGTSAIQELSGADGQAAHSNVYGLDRACVPRGIGRYGFTATCDHENTSRACEISSPLEVRTNSEICGQVLRPHDPGASRLSVSPRACQRGTFFIGYHSLQGVGRLEPSSLPACLQERGRILWVVNGSPLHELVTCSAARWELPLAMLGGVPPRLREDVVWQPAGAGFLLSTHSNCSNESAADIALAEVGWLEQHGAIWYDYFSLAQEYAPFMADGRHFTYYYLPCNDTFPELAGLAARMALNAGLRRPVSVCPMINNSSWRRWPSTSVLEQTRELSPPQVS